MRHETQEAGMERGSAGEALESVTDCAVTSVESRQRGMKGSFAPGLMSFAKYYELYINFLDDTPF